MFQLIISILAIILAVALAGVSVYYGGSAFSNGSESAQYATLNNQGAQIEAGMTLYRAQTGKTIASFDGHNEATAGVDVNGDGDATDVLDATTALEVLVANDYLKQIPSEGFTINATEGVIEVLGVGEAVCNASDNLKGDNTQTVADERLEALFVAGVSGCINGSDDNVFYYSI